jgi:hypothetical protein
MAFETILITTLLLAHLAIPPKFLQPFCFDSIGNCLRCEKVIFPHWQIWMNYFRSNKIIMLVILPELSSSYTTENFFSIEKTTSSTNTIATTKILNALEHEAVVF